MTIKRLGRFVSRYLYAAAACLYLLTIGLLSARNRNFLYRICAQFGYQPVKTLIPQVKLSDIIPPGTEIEIREPLGADGSVSLTELAAICSLIQHHRPDRLMEIGTLDGRTTLNIAANSAPSAQIYTLDLPGQPSGAWAVPVQAPAIWGGVGALQDAAVVSSSGSPISPGPAAGTGRYPGCRAGPFPHGRFRG